MHNTTFDYAISFSRDAADVFYPDSTELAKIVMAVIVVLFTAAVSLRYMTGEGTKMYQKTLLTSILFTLIFVQYYQLWFAILKLPTDFISTANRWDCLNSDKGGKVVFGSTADHMINPCFAHKNSTCTLSSATVHTLGDTPVNSKVYNVTLVKGENMTSTEACLADPAAASSFKGPSGLVAIPRFLEDMSKRDCSSARKAKCSQSEPCTPCELERKDEFGSRWSRCAQCTDFNTGKCNFVPEEGPYCYRSATSREVVPCVTCCTVPTLFFDEYGFCS